MTGADDWELLREYVRDGSQAAFAELVRRHVGPVYGTCRRQAGGDAHLAEDLTQAVFLLLATRARTMRQGVVLGGWLHRTACYVAANTRRAEVARRKREMVAVRTSEAAEHVGAAESAEELAALDRALARLREGERDAVVLRYIEGRSAL